MYYFEILDVLKKSDTELNAIEIFYEISRTRKCNMVNIKKILRKLYLKNDKVGRQIRKSKYAKNGGIEYIYFYIHD